MVRAGQEGALGAREPGAADSGHPASRRASTMNEATALRRRTAPRSPSARPREPKRRWPSCCGDRCGTVSVTRPRVRDDEVTERTATDPRCRDRRPEASASARAAAVSLGRPSVSRTDRAFEATSRRVAGPVTPGRGARRRGDDVTNRRDRRARCARPPRARPRLRPCGPTSCRSR